MSFFFLFNFSMHLRICTFLAVLIKIISIETISCSSSITKIYSDKYNILKVVLAYILSYYQFWDMILWSTRLDLPGAQANSGRSGSWKAYLLDKMVDNLLYEKKFLMISVSYLCLICYLIDYYLDSFYLNLLGVFLLYKNA